MRRAVVLLLAILLATYAGGCVKVGTISASRTSDGRVSLEEPARTQIDGDSTDPTAPVAQVFPPQYSEKVLPEFPEELLDSDMPPVTVRVHFRIGVDGRAHGTAAEISDGAPEPERFASACEEVLSRWRFSPAWRLALEGEPDDDGIVPVKSKGYLTFRFEIDRAIEVTFGQ